jgi:hypothetical protein
MAVDQRARVPRLSPIGIDDLREMDDRVPPAFGADDDGRPSSIGAKQGHGLQLLGFEEIWKPLPPVDYRIKPFLPRGCVGLINGYSSSMKSWLALHAALMVSLGLPWLSMETCETDVTVLDGEAGDFEDRRRLQRLLRGGVRTAKKPRLDLCSFPNLKISAPDFSPRFRALAETRGLIVIDTLHAFAPGIDENTTAMGDQLNRVQEIAKTTRCSVLVVTHAKKGGGDGDERESVRGSSSIFGAADAVLNVTYKGKGQPLRVRQTKARAGVEMEPLDVRVRDVGEGTVIDVALTQATTARGSSYSDLKKKIVETVRELEPASKNGIAFDVGGARGATLKAIDELVADGVIALVDGRFRTTGNHPGGRP